MGQHPVMINIMMRYRVLFGFGWGIGLGLPSSVCNTVLAPLFPSTCFQTYRFVVFGSALQKAIVPGSAKPLNIQTEYSLSENEVWAAYTCHWLDIQNIPIIHSGLFYWWFIVWCLVIPGVPYSVHKYINRVLHGNEGWKCYVSPSFRSIRFTINTVLCSMDKMVFLVFPVYWNFCFILYFFSF